MAGSLRGTSKMGLGRRGFVQDFLFILVFCIGFGLFLFALFIAWDAVNTSFQGAGIDTEGVFSSMFVAYQEYVDPLFLTVFIAVWVGALILAYFVSTHPILFWAFWMITMVGGVVAGYLSNAWIDVMAASPFDVIVTYFPITDYILSHFLHFIIIIGFSMILVFFAKPTGNELQVESL